MIARRGSIDPGDRTLSRAGQTRSSALFTLSPLSRTPWARVSFPSVSPPRPARNRGAQARTRTFHPSSLLEIRTPVPGSAAVGFRVMRAIPSRRDLVPLLYFPPHTAKSPRPFSLSICAFIAFLSRPILTARRKIAFAISNSINSGCRFASSR